MTESKEKFAATGRSRKGESVVWLCALGLTLGVLSTVGLLGLVLHKGFESFWPSRLVEMDVVTASGDTTRVAGYVVQKREERDLDGTVVEEIQLFRGNRELYGERFLFVDRDSIHSQSLPEDILLIERLEGGNAIGRGRALLLSGGQEVPVSSTGFRPALNAAIERAAERRSELYELEWKQIGQNSKRLKELRRQERVEGSQERRSLEIKKLQQIFAELDDRRRSLRALLDEERFLVESVDGREMDIPLGSLLHVYEANRAGFSERLNETLRRIWNFVSMPPREANMEGGVYPAIFGTVVMTLVMSLFVTPLGVVAAIYLKEYAKQGYMVRMVRASVANLAGVPSIVFGVFGLAFFIYFLGGVVDEWLFSDHEGPVFKSGGVLWASLTLALLTVPVVIVATEEALDAVPQGVREAALACGSSKWQMIQRVVLPASVPGVLTGVILAMARGAGEVAPLMLVGVVKSAPDLPIDSEAPFIHAERQFMHLGFHIYDLGFQSPDSEAAKPMVFATALLLITIVVVMNLTAILIRDRLQKKYVTRSF